MRRRDDTAFSELALAYFAAHAIDPAIAAQVGVSERRGSLVYPCVDGEGNFERTRSLTEGNKRTIQPTGRPLVCWWPAGRPTRARSVLVTEGEPDALAALSAIARADSLPDAPRGLLQTLAVVALPGVGFTPAKLAEELRSVGAEQVVLAPDGDDAGERCVERLAVALAAADLPTSRLALPAGSDLADCLAAASTPPEWLAGAVADSEALQPPSAAAQEGANGANGNGRPEPWPSLPGARPEFPLHALPAEIRRFVEAIAEETQTPADLAALAALGVLSSAALGPIEVDCGAWHEESLGLYLFVAMPSADRKSTVLKAAIAPLRAIERELQERSAQPRREHKRRREILLGRQASLTKTAAGQRDPDARKIAEAELTEVDAELEKLGEPVTPRMLADDATAEALGGLLAKHGRIAVIAAEAPLIANLTGRYSEKGVANLDLVNKAYSGEPTQIDRKNREPELIERPLMAITFTVQPHVLDAFAGHDTARQQGFVGRFGLVLPKSRVGRRLSKVQRAPANVHTAWAETVRRVSTANPLTQLTELGGSARSGGHSVGSVSESADTSFNLLLSLSFGARELLDELREGLEPRLGEDGDLFLVADWIGRHPGRIVRIAGLLHLAQGRAEEEEISAATMGSALEIGEYLLAHSLAALIIRDERMRRHIRWLAAWREETVSQRDLHRGPLGSRGSAEDARALAEELVAVSALRPVHPAPRMPGQPGQPASPTYEINPRLRGAAPLGAEEEWWRALIAEGPPELPPELPGAEDTVLAFAGNGNGAHR